MVNGAINATNANGIVITGDVNATSTSTTLTEIYGFKANNVTCYYDDQVYSGTGAAIYVNNVSTTAGTAIKVLGKVTSVTGAAVVFEDDIQGDKTALEIKGKTSSAETGIIINVVDCGGTAIQFNGYITSANGYGIEFNKAYINIQSSSKYSLYAHGGVWNHGLLIGDDTGNDLLTIT